MIFEVRWSPKYKADRLAFTCRTIRDAETFAAAKIASAGNSRVEIWAVVA